MLEKMREIQDRIEGIKDRCRELRGQRKPQLPKETFNKVLQEAGLPTTTPQEPPAKATALPRLPPNGTTAPIELRAPAQKPNDVFSSLIDKYARLHNLDPKLVRRLIEVESDFDPACISSKGAMGLMQLMPETAQELGVENPFDPEQNISGGTRYLAQMLEREGGNLARALAAYNAGPTTVRDYNGIPPYPETRNYIRKILGKLPGDDASEKD
ncbi:MAG TPA: lytic transglycosylase domain-containing protein [Candidatus Ozemobacteraceae bacterium]|nr:lytic transglycosylase domain-containing protein [Candidatus Ozemobacteraceae bacterium]